MHIFSEDYFRFLQLKISGNAQSSTVVPAKMAVESAAQVSIALFKVLSFSSMLYHSRLVMYKTLGGIFLIQPYSPSLFCCFLQFEPIAALSYSVMENIQGDWYQVLNRILTIMFTVLLVSSSLHD